MIKTPLGYSRQTISEEDIEAVVRILESDNLTQGPLVTEFEQAIASYCDQLPVCNDELQTGKTVRLGPLEAVAVNSATSALHIACLALGLSEGDWLWTSANSFIASANCGRYCGANVGFLDIDPATGNLCVDALREKFETAARDGKLPKILVVVHFAGQPCDMAEIFALANQYDCKLIEDASHALGASYQQRKIGGCQFSEITVFSFHPVKMITTGEGGMALTRDAELAKKMRCIAHQGVNRHDRVLDDMLDAEVRGNWLYEAGTLGFNYRLTDIQAALGVSQLKRLDEYVHARGQQATIYDQAFESLPITPLSLKPNRQSSHHLYVIRLSDITGRQRKKLYEQCHAQQIRVQVHYIPIPYQPYYRELGVDPKDYPNAIDYYQSALSLPLFPTLTEQDQQLVIDCVQSFCKACF